MINYSITARAVNPNLFEINQATPKTGFAFDKWSDGSTQNPRTVKLTSDLTLTASFKTATTGGGDQGCGGDQGGGTLGD